MAEFIRRASALFEPNSTPALKSRATADIEYCPSYTKYAVNCGIAVVADLFLHFVEEDWVQDLDFKTLNRVNTKLQADNLKQREGDIIYRV